MMFQLAFNMFPEMLRTTFKAHYQCFSVALFPGSDRKDVERGGKIIMPPSALQQLSRLNINYPMLFKITNKDKARTTHCGVLEFIADEGHIYIPQWMMRNLLLDESDWIKIENISLPVATFSRFQPQTTEFLDISNPKAVLENGLRYFACLTTGDMIAIQYNEKSYELCVLETKPGNAVAIIECDMNVEFAPPADYEESAKSIESAEAMNKNPSPAISGFFAFQGQGNRLDGKRKTDSAGTSASSSPRVPHQRGIPDLDYEIGTLHFLRYSKPKNENKEEVKKFQAFAGAGNVLNDQ